MYANVGTFDAGVITSPAAAMPMAPGMSVMDEAGIKSAGAFLVSELEKKDTMVRKPLSTVTYPRDVVIKSGGGWAEYVSAMSVSYGLTGGAGNGPVTAGGANGVPIVQTSVDKGLYKTHAFSVALRIMLQDMQKSNFVGRSLDQLLTDGVRMAYDKHNDQNVYVGLNEYGTTGLVNNPDAVETTVATGASGKTNWAEKTPDEILNDVNTAITTTWAAAAYDLGAIPNHILIPYEEYTYILTTKVTDLATETIFDYIMRNNVAAKNGGSLFIGATSWCQGAGTSQTDRMVVYVNHERFVKMDELVPLGKVMTAPNVSFACYDTLFMANLSEVQIMYPQTITYWDGIGGAA